MTAICGTVGRHEAPAGGVDAMLAAMTHSGADVASWTDAGVSLGRRCAAGDGATPRGVPAPAPDVPGTVVVADARLDDRDTLCGALGLPPAARAAHDDRAPHREGVPAMGRRLSAPPPRRLRLRRVGRGEAHAVLRSGPRRRAAVLLCRDAARVRLRQRHRSRARRPGRRPRARRIHGGDVADEEGRGAPRHKHVLPGRAQAAAGAWPCRHERRGAAATPLAAGGRAAGGAGPPTTTTPRSFWPCIRGR